MRKNRNQLLVLWCGIALIAVMCLYVPWNQPATDFKFGDGVVSTSTPDCGYGLIFILKGGQRLDARRLGIQCGLVALIAAGLIVTFREPTKRP